MSKMLKAALWSTLILVPAAAYAQWEPPIRSHRDTACRLEAGRRVLSEQPNVRGLRQNALRRQFFLECMQRTERRSYRR